MIVGMARGPWWRRTDVDGPDARTDEPVDDQKDPERPERPLTMKERMAQLI